MNAAQPIGVFDSGIGGLTVAKAIAERLPNESLIYFGDTAHLPYGDKSADAIRYYAINITRVLLEKGCKMIVVACNSASAAAYEILLDFYADRTHLVNVVDPLVATVQQYDFSKVGIIATKATVRSGVYSRKLREAMPTLEVAALPTPLLVPMIEEGFVHNNISHEIIKRYLADPKLQGIDALLLACTHYPLIRKEIEAYYAEQVQVFDSNRAAAEVVAATLAKHGLLYEGERQPHQFYVSDYTDNFEQATQLFYGKQVTLGRLSIWKE